MLSTTKLENFAQISATSTYLDAMIVLEQINAIDQNNLNSLQILMGINSQ